MYEIASSMLYALTGKYHVEINEDEGFAKSDFLKGSLLEQGHLSRERYEQALENTVNSLKGSAKKYRRLIKRCLTLDESKRYSSIEDLDVNSQWETPDLEFEELKPYFINTKNKDIKTEDKRIELIS